MDTQRPRAKVKKLLFYFSVANIALILVAKINSFIKKHHVSRQNPDPHSIYSAKFMLIRVRIRTLLVMMGEQCDKYPTIKSFFYTCISGMRERRRHNKKVYMVITILSAAGKKKAF